MGGSEVFLPNFGQLVLEWTEVTVLRVQQGGRSEYCLISHSLVGRAER